MNKKEYKKIRKLLGKGCYKAIADECNCSESTVKGVFLNARKDYFKITETAVQMYNDKIAENEKLIESMKK